MNDRLFSVLRYCVWGILEHSSLVQASLEDIFIDPEIKRFSSNAYDTSTPLSPFLSISHDSATVECLANILDQILIEPNNVKRGGSDEE